MSAVLETREPFPPLAGLLAYWRQMKPREKRLTGVAAAFLFLVVLWLLALAPALKTLRQAPDQHRDLDVKIQAMQRLNWVWRMLKPRCKARVSSVLEARHN